MTTNRSRGHAVAGLAAAFVAGCGGEASRAPVGATTAAASPSPLAPEPSSDRASASPPSPGAGARARQAPTSKAADGAGPRPTRSLSIPEARRYMLGLINRDRASQGLGPVELDEGAPTAAGQAHAEDMARLGYLGHWGSDGSVPEQRHTEAGGADMVLENALCFVDEKTRELDGEPRIDPAQVERAEQQFFDEVPPRDGHRRNILKPSHTRVGIGIAQPIGTAAEIAVPCFAQEFTDRWGTYAPIPKTAKVGATVHVEGVLAGDAKPTGVGVARIPAPKALAPRVLNERRSYPVSKPYQMYWTKGFVTPVPVAVDGPRFSIDVPLSDERQRGLYEISVWAKLPGSDAHTMVGLRTLLVE